MRNKKPLSEDGKRFVKENDFKIEMICLGHGDIEWKLREAINVRASDLGLRWLSRMALGTGTSEQNIGSIAMGKSKASLASAQAIFRALGYDLVLKKRKGADIDTGVV